MRGSIQKRANGYSVVVDAGKDHRGKRKQIRRSGFRTKQEAEAKLTELLSQVQEGKQVFTNRIDIRDLLEKYDEVHLSHLKDSTSNSYRSGYKRFLKFLKEYRLEYIKPYHIQEAYHELSKSFSVYSHNQSYTAMKNFFVFAMENEFIKTNPHRASMKKLPKSEITIWSKSDINAFLEACKDYPVLHAMYYLTLHTGMRLSEIRGLIWDDIDLTNKIIHVRAALSWKEFDFNKRRETKTNSSVRKIYITDQTVEVLKNYKKRDWVANVHNGVFATRFGRSIAHPFIQEKLDKYAKIAKVDRIRFHDLRHTHASLLIQEGVNVKIVSERLGHSDVSTTLNIYTHFNDETRREAAEIFEAVTRNVT